MIMKANTNTKTNNRKKLIPAAGALMISAAMLGTSTYAWFTMSREVELQNIQMTATVPEDIQISLGKIGTTSDVTAQSTKTADGALAMTTGYLMNTGNVVTPPREDGTDFDNIDWSNTADVSHYYSFGKLIPASSDTGESIFFTPDANGIGQTVKTTARYFTAVNGVTTVAESDVTGDGSGTLNATAHINTGASWTATQSSAWNATGDDGYYIDIPVWLRTSSKDATTVSVKAYVKDLTQIPNFGTNDPATDTNKELYRAVRVAILTPSGTAAATSGGNLLPVADGEGTLAALTNNSDPYTGSSVLDWYSAVASNAATVSNPSVVHGGAVNAVATQGTTTPNYTASPTAYTPGTSVATLAARTTGSYGAATQVIVRIWLEGEDPDCYNETAGQDWSINLMFDKIEATQQSGGNTGG